MAIDFTKLPETLYYLLYSKYGNNSIASSDHNQFKYKVMSLIFEYGPAWKTRLKLQDKLSGLDLDGDDVLRGTTAIYNHAENPDTDPSTTTTPIEYKTIEGINSQNTTSYRRGKLEGYNMLAQLIETDVTQEFLDKFKNLFIKFVGPQKPLWYGPVEGYDIEEDVQELNSSLYGNYRTNTFQQIWPSAADFVSDYNSCGIPTTI